MKEGDKVLLFIPFIPFALNRSTDADMASWGMNPKSGTWDWLVWTGQFLEPSACAPLGTTNN